MYYYKIYFLFITVILITDPSLIGDECHTVTHMGMWSGQLPQCLSVCQPICFCGQCPTFFSGSLVSSTVVLASPWEDKATNWMRGSASHYRQYKLSQRCQVQIRYCFVAYRFQLAGPSLVRPSPKKAKVITGEPFAKHMMREYKTGCSNQSTPGQHLDLQPLACVSIGDLAGAE